MNKRLTMVLKMGRGLMWTLDILVRAEIHFLDTFCCFYLFIFFHSLSLMFRLQELTASGRGGSCCIKRFDWVQRL